MNRYSKTQKDSSLYFLRHINTFYYVKLINQCVYKYITGVQLVDTERQAWAQMLRLTFLELVL